ncbi:hypothetical protein ACNOYE_37410 [Nannocystaceae bacterium ST9]
MRRLGFLGLVSISLLSACASDAGPGDVDRPASEERRAFGGSREQAPRDEWAPRAEPTQAAEKSGGYGGDTSTPGAAPVSPSDEAMGTRWDDGEFEADAIARDDSRPGLGTAYGETRSSSVDTVSFRRADRNTPDVVFSIHYDDVAGVREVARGQRTRAWSDEARLRQGDLTFALLDEAGDVLPAASVGSQLYAIGAPETRYGLAVANDSNTTYEVVLSVDGLDVIDGRPAGFDKRGYVIDPFSSVVIDGWRTSEDTVAAFRFSSIEDSYADRTGESRNIGVIGAAFFREAPRHWEDWRAPEDTRRRETADPFPGSR